MTTQQRNRFYFPIWSTTAAKLDWKMAGGRLLADLNEQANAAIKFPDHAAALFETILLDASRAASAEARATTADDLRHACNRIASGGHHSSSTKFSQRHLNHFDRLCAVLRDPWDITATIAWLNPIEDDRMRTIAYLKKLANEGRLIAICLNAWGTPDWESLDQARLDALTAELKKNAWPKFPRKPDPRTQTQPF